MRITENLGGAMGLGLWKLRGLFPQTLHALGRVPSPKVLPGEEGFDNSFGGGGGSGT